MSTLLPVSPELQGSFHIGGIQVLIFFNLRIFKLSFVRLKYTFFILIVFEVLFLFKIIIKIQLFLMYRYIILQHLE